MPFVPPDNIMGDGLPKIGAGKFALRIEDATYGSSEKTGNEFLRVFMVNDKHGTYTHFITMVNGRPKITNQSGEPTTHHSRQYAQLLRAVDYPTRDYWEKDKKDPLPDLNNHASSQILNHMQGKTVIGHVGYWANSSELRMLKMFRGDELDPDTLGPENVPIQKEKATEVAPGMDSISPLIDDRGAPF